MTTPADGRGGRTPPRPAPDSERGQWLVFRPGAYNADAATALLRAAPHPAVPLPVTAWARACGLTRDPAASRRLSA
jgi:hypothetical protein